MAPSSSATVPKEKSGGGGCGCGSAGGLDLVGGLGLLLLVPRLRRRAARPRRGRPAAPGLALAAVLALGASACGKSSSERCPDGSTACGSLCCAAGYACSAGSCVLATPNPFLQGITPPNAGVGGTVNLAFSGTGFEIGAEARLSGAGVPGTVALSVTSPTAATALVDLTQAAEGPVEVRVANPGNFVSNAVVMNLSNGPVPLALDKTSLRQDAGPVDLVITGRAFAAGLVASLSRSGGALQPQPTTYLSPTQVKITGLDPGTLAVAVYDVTVAFPGGDPSPPVKLPVVEGAPILTAISPSCAQEQTSIAGSVTGSYLYPSSTVHVSFNTDSVLSTQCSGGVSSLGRCVAGLSVLADLPPGSAGSYEVWVVNPGAPTPLESAHKAFTVTAGSCP